MDLFESVAGLILKMVQESLVSVVVSLLLFYLIISALLVLIRIVKGVRR